MHKEILEHISEDKLRDFARDALSMIKETNKDLYDELELYLYKEVYGCHFSDWLLKKATTKMVNEDGSYGAHWSLSETTSAAKQYDVRFEKFNEYDWSYVMNMIYSDYYGSVSNDVSTYVKMSRKFLEDKDACEGKALKYYLAMK